MKIELNNNSITKDQNEEFMNAFINGEIKLLPLEKFIDQVNFLHAVREHATCARHKIASTVYVNSSLISMGYNTGAISSSKCTDLEQFMIGECRYIPKLNTSTKPKNDRDLDADDYRNELHPIIRENEIHAEAMAISGLASRVEVLFKDTALDIDIFITKFPCIKCANTIYEELKKLSVLRRVNIYYLDEWANTDCSIIDTLAVFKHDFRFKLFRLSEYC